MSDEYDTYETKDLVAASYLKVSGHYCIGTIPAGNPYKPLERLWLFEDSADLQADLERLERDDQPVPVKEVFRCASILKNLLNDKDE